MLQFLLQIEMKGYHLVYDICCVIHRYICVPFIDRVVVYRVTINLAGFYMYIQNCVILCSVDFDAYISLVL